ncbi:hypothetical protein TSUD_93530 [Trifolium subterraneum]|uniref:Uncharacterized protein n=1 Tax=Trifolium subterraneum TaxID=3900 RepID=A0A2Z6MHJ2_TRISU|nr:hypothetical protein TSUD_93530 [Trifolium subterraneum]
MFVSSERAIRARSPFNRRHGRANSLDVRSADEARARTDGRGCSPYRWHHRSFYAGHVLSPVLKSRHHRSDNAGHSKAVKSNVVEQGAIQDMVQVDNSKAKFDRFVREERVGGSGVELEKVNEEAVRSEEERERARTGEGGSVKEWVEQVREMPVLKDGDEVVEKPAGEEVVSDTVLHYLPLYEDTRWAANCRVARIKNGLCVSVVQQFLADAGLKGIRLIPLGGDNVLISPSLDIQGGDIFQSAAHDDGSKRSSQTKRRLVVPSVKNLKRIARLSEEDRKALIRSLKKSKRQKPGSKASSRSKQGTSLSIGSSNSNKSVGSKDWKN